MSVDSKDRHGSLNPDVLEVGFAPANINWFLADAIPRISWMTVFVFWWWQLISLSKIIVMAQSEGRIGAMLHEPLLNITVRQMCESSSLKHIGLAWSGGRELNNRAVVACDATVIWYQFGCYIDSWGQISFGCICFGSRKNCVWNVSPKRWWSDWRVQWWWGS